MTTKEKALALVNEVLEKRGLERQQYIDRLMPTEEALCRAVELLEQEKVTHAERLMAMHSIVADAETQHEATKKEFADFQQKVSDALQTWVEGGIDRPAYLWFRKKLEQFIIAKPDPLVDVLLELELSSDPEEGQHDAKWIRHKLNAAGFEIRKKNDD